jgi:hypothetical protein
MTMTLEVEILPDGTIHPLSPTKLPAGRATLSWNSPEDHECYILSEAALATDWLRPEEDEAWAEWQPVK